MSSHTARSNVLKLGAIAFRYAKGEPVDGEAAAFQAAFAYGYLRGNPFEELGEPEHKLCLVLDNYAGEVHAAPGNSVERFNNMVAACATIADSWQALPPPPKAMLA